MTTGALGVALCRRVAIAHLFAERMAELTPHRLLDPSEVTDPSAITFALAFLPEPGAFVRYPNIKVVVSIGAGAEGIVSAPSLPPHVPVVRMTDSDQADQMAAFALFHIVYWHRRFDRLFAAAEVGRWARIPGDRRSPRTETIGVLGYGPMGRRIAEVTANLGYATRTYSRRPPDPADPNVAHFHGDGLDAFLGGTTVLVACLPGTPETRGLMDLAFLRRLPRGAALIQIGRGGQLVEADLVTALDEGHLRGASLDVFAEEPLPPEHPFWRDPRIVATPHTASEASGDAVVRSVAEALDALAAGRTPRGLVDRSRGY